MKNPTMITAVIAAIVAVISALVSLYSQIRVVKLRHKFEQQKKDEEKKQQFEQLLAKYRNPLLRVAQDLQSRLFNIVQKSFFKIHYHDSKQSEEYALNNTLFVIAEFMGWQEILRKQNMFLDLGEVELNIQFTELIEHISQLFLTDEINMAFRLFRGEQRAIGEIMIIGDKPENNVCLGYAEFCRKLQEPEFCWWFSTLKESIISLARKKEVNEVDDLIRLVTIQHGLIDLIDFLDPGKTRISQSRRSKIAL